MLLPLALTAALLPLISAAALGHAAHGSRAHHAAPAAHKRQVFHAEVRPRNATAQQAGAVQGPMDKRTSSVLGKRAYPNSRATYYDIGLGACGQYSHEPDFIVALNSAQYGGGYPGPECFKWITITGGGRGGTAQAQILDECPGCPYGGLDMSYALFQVFDSLDTGVSSVTWWYNDAAPATTSSTSQWVAPTTTSTTSQWVAPTISTTSTSQWVAPTTTSTSTSSTPTPSSSTSSYTPSSSSVASSSSSMAPSSTISRNSTIASLTSAFVSRPSSTAVNGTTDSTNSDGTTNTDGTTTVSTLSNLEMLGTITAQYGGLIVQAAMLS